MKKSYQIELIAAFYINMFFLLKPILKISKNNSKNILLVMTAILVILYLKESSFSLKKVKLLRWVYLNFMIVLLCCLSYFGGSSTTIYDYYYYYFIYGAVTTFFFINIRYYKIFLRYWVCFSLLSGVIIFLDPLYKYRLTGSYMSYGEIIFYSLVSSLLIYKFFNKKIIGGLFSLCFLFMIVLYAHKGAIVSSIFTILIFCLYNRKKIYQIRFLGIVFVMIIVVKIFFFKIIHFLLYITRSIGVYSYSLGEFEHKIYEFNKFGSVLSRVFIWKQAIFEIKQHFVFGMGIGNFESVYGNYPHNFILDIFTTFGCIFGSLIIIFILKKIFDIKKNKDNSLKIFLLLMCICWFFPTIFSLTFWKVQYFWIFILESLNKKTKIIGGINEGTNTYI